MPEVLIVNPIEENPRRKRRTKKRRAATKRRRAARHAGKRHTRRHARRAAPRRQRRRAHRHARPVMVPTSRRRARHSRRRHYRRNPSVGGVFKAVGLGALGGLVVKASGFGINRIPVSKNYQDLIAVGVQLAETFGLAMLSSTVGAGAAGAFVCEAWDRVEYFLARRSLEQPQKEKQPEKTPGTKGLGSVAVRRQMTAGGLGRVSVFQGKIAHAA